MIKEGTKPRQSATMTGWKWETIPKSRSNYQDKKLGIQEEKPNGLKNPCKTDSGFCGYCEGLYVDGTVDCSNDNNGCPNKKSDTAIVRLSAPAFSMNQKGPEQLPLGELVCYPNWVNWISVQSGERTDKIPIDPKNGRYSSVQDPSKWGCFLDAWNRLEKSSHYKGFGLVLTSNLNIICLDIDNCRDLITGTIKEEAYSIIRQLNSLTEISQSGKGVHIFVLGKLKDNHRIKSDLCEIYSKDHFIAMTGNWLPDTPHTIYRRQEEITALYAELFSDKDRASSTFIAYNRSSKSMSGLGDDQIIEHLKNHRNSEIIMALMNGDVNKYSSQSSADLAFCNYLSQCTNDPEQIDRIVRKSKLYRPKWDSRRRNTTYGAMTIARALEGKRGVPQGGRS